MPATRGGCLLLGYHNYGDQQHARFAGQLHSVRDHDLLHVSLRVRSACTASIFSNNSFRNPIKHYFRDRSDVTITLSMRNVLTTYKKCIYRYGARLCIWTLYRHVTDVRPRAGEIGPIRTLEGTGYKNEDIRPCHFSRLAVAVSTRATECVLRPNINLSRPTLFQHHSPTVNY